MELKIYTYCRRNKVSDRTSFFLPRNIKWLFVKENYSEVFIIKKNLETSLSKLIDRDNSNASRDIVENFIKTRVSMMYRHKIYSIDVPGISIVVPVPQ